jgi:hypothetical protein
MLSQSSKGLGDPTAGGPSAATGLRHRRGLGLIVVGLLMSGLSVAGLVLVVANARGLTGGSSEGLGFLVIPMGVLFGLGLLFLIFGAVQYGKGPSPPSWLRGR